MRTKRNVVRSVNAIDNIIRMVEMRCRFEVETLKQEKFLVETLDSCKNDDEREIVETLGPDFIAQHFDELEKFMCCSCVGDTERGFPFDAGRFMRTVFKSLSVPLKDRLSSYEYDMGHWFLLTNGRRDHRDCFYRYELVRAYCLVKNDPAILERIEEELKAKKAT